MSRETILAAASVDADDPQALAKAVAHCWIGLGGTVTLQPNGVRYYGRSCSLDLHDPPQIDGLDPHQQPLNEQQWDGALRMIDALIDVMSAEERTAFVSMADY